MSAYDTLILADSPVSFWKLDEASGTTAADSADSNPGTINAGWAYGSAGIGDGSTALTADGLSRFIDAANPANLQIGTVTLESWIQATAPGTGFRCIAAKELAYSLFLIGSVLSVYDWGSSTTRSTGLNLADGLWHHVALTMQSGVTNGSIVYSDGVAALTTTVTVSAQTGSFQIAANHNSQYIAGTLAKTAVYGSVLTPERIAAHYNFGRRVRQRFARPMSVALGRGSF